MKSTIRILALIVVLLFSLNLYPAYYGYSYLKIPILGMFDSDEGTIEFMIRFDTNPLEKVEGRGNYKTIARLICIDCGDQSFKNDGITVSAISRNIGNRSSSGVQCAMLFSFISEKSVSDPAGIDFGQNAEQGKWYHVAVMWSREAGKIWTFLDGKPSSHRIIVFNPFNPSFHSGACICFGSGDASIDNLRISSIARTPETLLTGGKAIVDDKTLFMMDFNETEGGKIIPNYTASTLGRNAYLLPGNFSLVSGVDGYALSLHKKDKQE